MFTFRPFLSGSIKDVTPSAGVSGSIISVRGGGGGQLNGGAVWPNAMTSFRSVFVGGRSQDVLCLTGRHGLEPEDNLNLRRSAATGAFDRDLEGGSTYASGVYRCSGRLTFKNI